MKKLIIFSILGGLIAAGCATQRMYSGEELPEDQIAILTGGEGVPYLELAIVRIGEHPVTEEFCTEIQLLPGSYEIILKSALFVSAARRHLPLEFIAKAGHTYELIAEEVSSTFKYYRIEDVTEKEGNSSDQD